MTAAIGLSDTSALKNVPLITEFNLKPLSPTITYLINLLIENVVAKALGAPELSVQTQRADYLNLTLLFLLLNIVIIVLLHS